MSKRMSISKFNRMVRAAVRSRHVSRVRIVSKAIPGNTTTTVGMLAIDDDPDYDLTADGTNLAEAEPKTRLLSVKLNVILHDFEAGDRVEWILLKDPDEALMNIVPSDLFTADVGATAATMLRKYALAYGQFIFTANNDLRSMRVRIKRAALRRAGVLHDGDRLKFRVSNSNATLGGLMNVWGTITWG